MSLQYTDCALRDSFSLKGYEVSFLCTRKRQQGVINSRQIQVKEAVLVRGTQERVVSWSARPTSFCFTLTCISIFDRDTFSWPPIKCSVLVSSWCQSDTEPTNCYGQWLARFWQYWSISCVARLHTRALMKQTWFFSLLVPPFCGLQVLSHYPRRNQNWKLFSSNNILFVSVFRNHAEDFIPARECVVKNARHKECGVLWLVSGTHARWWVPCVVVVLDIKGGGLL
jgi:hypothetical protein